MKEYKVSDKNSAGLTVDDYVRKPGAKFFYNEWKWGDEALEAAIESGRCEMTYDDSEENVKKIAKVEKPVKSEKTDKEKQIEQLEKMQDAYSKMDSKDAKAIQLLKSIEKLEADIKL